MSNVIRFPVEKTQRGKIEAAWKVYQEALIEWFSSNPTDMEVDKPIVDHEFHSKTTR